MQSTLGDVKWHCEISLSPEGGEIKIPAPLGTFLVFINGLNHVLDFKNPCTGMLAGSSSERHLIL